MNYHVKQNTGYYELKYQENTLKVVDKFCRENIILDVQDKYTYITRDVKFILYKMEKHIETI